MNEITQQDDPEFYKTCLKAHGYKVEESDDGKSQSDDELRSMKPPPIPYNKFKNKIIKVGSNSHKTIAKKKCSNTSNRKNTRKDSNKKKTTKKPVEQIDKPTQILSVSTLTEAYNPSTEGKHISPLDQRNALCDGNNVDGNKFMSSKSRASGVHADISTQFLSASSQRPNYNPFAEVTHISTPGQSNENNVDDNKLRSSKSRASEVYADISNQFLSVAPARPTTTFTQVTRISQLDQCYAICNGNNVDGNKSTSSKSRASGVHADTSTQFQSVSSQGPNYNPFAEVTHILTPGQSNGNNVDDNKLRSSKSRANGLYADISTQFLSVAPARRSNTLTQVTRISTLDHYNSLCDGNNVDSNKFTPSESRAGGTHTNTSTQFLSVSSQRPNYNPFAEVTHISTPGQSKGNNVDDNNLISCRVGSVRADIPTQFSSVSLPRQTGQTLAKIRRKSNPYQLMHNEDNAATDEPVLSRVNEEQTNAQPHEYQIQAEEGNGNQGSSTTRAKILGFLCCNII